MAAAGKQSLGIRLDRFDLHHIVLKQSMQRRNVSVDSRQITLKIVSYL